MSDNRTELEQAITKEIETLSPLLVESNSLLEKAKSIVITDKDTARLAKNAKRELIAHRTRVIDLRKSFTRNLDNLKSQLVSKQDEILKPSIEGEAILTASITEWEDEQARLKKEEEERIQKILRRLDAPKLDRKTVSEDEVHRAMASIKMELGLVDEKTRKRKAVKEHVAAQTAILKETLEFVHDRDAQTAEAKRLADERAELEKQKAEAKASEAPTKADTVATPSATATNPAKDESTVDKTGTATDQAIKDGMNAGMDAIFNPGEESAYSLVNDLGQAAMEEAAEVLQKHLDEIEGQTFNEESADEWRCDTIEKIYQVIAKYQ